MQSKKLVTMANQIGTFFASYGQSEAVAGTVNHLKKFWDPRMRAEIIAHLRAGGEGLRPEVRLAVETLAGSSHEPAAVAPPPAPASGVKQNSRAGSAPGDAPQWLAKACKKPACSEPSAAGSAGCASA